MNEKWYDTAARVGARIIELLHWIAAATLAALLIFSFFFAQDIGAVLAEGVAKAGSEELASYGFRVALVVDDAARGVSLAAFRLFLGGAAITLSLMAMVFRNVYLILRNTRGGTPFVPDNIRMLREIGWFSIAQPAVGLVVSVLVQLTCGIGRVDASVDIDSLIIGLLALCLTRVFARGMELERDTEGLL